MGDKLLLKLNINGRPIANKYCEGKMKRTLKKGLKDLKSLKSKGSLKRFVIMCISEESHPLSQYVKGCDRVLAYSDLFMRTEDKMRLRRAKYKLTVC